MTVMFVFDIGNGNSVAVRDAWLAFRSLTGLPLCQTGIDPNLKFSRILFWIGPTAAHLLCGLQGNAPPDFQHNLFGARVSRENGSPDEILAELKAAEKPKLEIIPNRQLAA